MSTTAGKGKKRGRTRLKRRTQRHNDVVNMLFAAKIEAVYGPEGLRFLARMQALRQGPQNKRRVLIRNGGKP